MNWELAILWFVTLIISLTVHEAAHALFAMIGGDRTAYRAGQVTLNPLPHIQREPFGMLALPLLVLFMSNGHYCLGYASTPIDPIWAYHHPRKAAVMSAAGPMANLLLAAIAFAVLAMLGHPSSDTADAIARIAEVFLLLNVILCLFNLIPLPPLDGAGVVEGLIPPLRRFYDFLRQQPMIGLVTMIVAWRVLDVVQDPVFEVIGRWLHQLR